MDIWIYKDGKYAGRFPESVIREKLNNGSFTPADLAWNDRLMLWQHIPDFLAGVVPPPVLPVRQGATAPPAAAQPPAVPAAAAAAHPPPARAIWNPIPAVLWSLLLTPVFGAFIVWRNWVNMKRPRRATAAVSWLGIALTLVALRVITISTRLPLWVSLVFFAAWFFFSALPQIRYVGTHFKKPYPKRHWFLPLGVGIALYLIVFGLEFLAEKLQKPLASLKQHSQQQTSSKEIPQARNFSPEEIRDMYRSSVLEVRATSKQRVRPLWMDKTESSASGTGVLLCNDNQYGLIATNWHVVESAQSGGDFSCGVRFSPDKDFSDCLLVARAKNGVDLALLLVHLEGNWRANQFPVRPLDQIREGEACVAIGNALGEGLSITSGVVSKFDKNGDITLIRTSAPVSPGNSGGPLILCKGATLAGIVTLSSQRETIQNVNFATPAQYLLNKDGWDFNGDQPQALQLLDTAVREASRSSRR